MKLLRTTALTAALYDRCRPDAHSPAHAWGWGWRGGGWGWGWGGAALGLAASVARWPRHTGVTVVTAMAIFSRLRLWLPGNPGYGYGSLAMVPVMATDMVPVMATPRLLWLWHRLQLPSLWLWLWDRLRLFGLRLRIWDRLQLPGLRLRLSPRCPTPPLCHHCSRPASLELLSLAKPRDPPAEPPH